MGPDQFVTFYTVVMLGVIAGTLFSAFTFSKERIIWHLLGAEALILLACALDYHLTSDVRPADFYRSQFLVGFAGGMFIGPLLLTGIISALQKGPSHIVTFIVLFSATQTFGGLVGSSFFSTYQQVRTQNYQAEMYANLNLTQAQLEQRLDSYVAQAHRSTIDPVLAQQTALKMLQQNLNKEAQVRAYNDVIFLNGIFAVLILLWGLFVISKNRFKDYRYRWKWGNG